MRRRKREEDAAQFQQVRERRVRAELHIQTRWYAQLGMGERGTTANNLPSKKVKKSRARMNVRGRRNAISIN